jgi:hypothetical protein
LTNAQPPLVLEVSSRATLVALQLFDGAHEPIKVRLEASDPAPGCVVRVRRFLVCE